MTSKHIPGMLSLPFVYEATVKAERDRVTRTLSNHYLATGPVQPIEISAEDLGLAIHAKWRHGGPHSHDRIKRFGKKLYRRLEVEGLPIHASAICRGFSESESSAIDAAVRHLPPPETSLTPRYGLHSPRLIHTMDQASTKGRWQLRSVETSNQDDRWNEACVHYHDAVLIVGDELFLRCAEPAWRYPYDRTIKYWKARDAVDPYWQFGLDRIDEIKSFVGAMTRLNWDGLHFDTIIHHLDWEFDDCALVLDLGRHAMSYVPAIRKLTTKADRQDLRCEAAFRRMEALRLSPGQFTVTDAVDAVDTVDALGQRLYDAIRIRRVAHGIRDELPRAKARVRYLADKAQEISDDDMEALVDL